MVSIRRAYGPRTVEREHPLPLGALVGGAGAVCLAAATRSSAFGALIAAVVWALCGRRRAIALALLVTAGVAAGWRAEESWRSLAPDSLGSFTGWARVVDDPQPFPSSTRIVLELDGERFEMWARGRALRGRVDRWRGGTFVHVHGTRVQLDDDRRNRVAWQHVVGEFHYEWASDESAGGPVAVASNRVRSLLEAGARALRGDDAALFRGLVIGDDRDQPPDMLARFRASGLSHLTAVSGQNVAYVLLGVAPVLRRLGPWARWAATLGLIGWFVVLTRSEPSIVRAGAMAALSATGFVLGRPRAPARLLAVAVGALVLIDPLLVRSVGFQLSVGATAGVVTLGPRLARRLRRLGPLAEAVGVTLGAQLGVAVPQLLVFGSMPVVALPANLLAVPVAGAVMLYGLPAGLLAGAVPWSRPVVMLPCRLGVRWVDTVAAVAARAGPNGVAAGCGWVLTVSSFTALAVLDHRRPAGGSAPDLGGGGPS